MRRPPTKKPFPGWGALFSIGGGGGRGQFIATLDQVEDDGFGLARGEHRPRRPLAARWAMGGASPGPAVWTDLVSLLLLSPRLADALNEEGLSGWDSLPVALMGKDEVIVPGYQVLIVTGRCGPVVDGRSKEVLKDLPGGTFPVWTGLYFDEATWDGSDFFMPAGHNGHLFATKRVVDAFARANATGVRFTPLSDVERSMLMPSAPERIAPQSQSTSRKGQDE